VARACLDKMIVRDNWEGLLGGIDWQDRGRMDGIR
jgi:hypothetical protein